MEATVEGLPLIQETTMQPLNIVYVAIRNGATFKQCTIWHIGCRIMDSVL